MYVNSEKEAEGFPIVLTLHYITKMYILDDVIKLKTLFLSLVITHSHCLYFVVFEGYYSTVDEGGVRLISPSRIQEGLW